jgi:hypothetical protein
MRRLFRRLFIRNLEGPDLFLTFLLSAVGAILGIRFFLHLSGYPQLGGGGLHIAHMLWGGLLLLVAVVMLLGFLDRHTQRLAAVIGGIGWGAFIDELGKFITRDHNYFFAPTVALIYVSFVALYLTFHAISRMQALRDDEYEANAMRVIADGLVHGLTVDHRARVRAYLAHTRVADPIAHAIAELLHTVDAAPAPPPSRCQRVQAWLQPRYAQVVRHHSFRIALELFFAGHVVLGVTNALTFAWSALVGGDGARDMRAGDSFVDLGRLGCSAVAALFVIVGIVRLRNARLQAYQHFRTAVLISILLTEFFVFLQVQFSALPGFALNLAILLVLGQLIEQERELATNGPTRASPESSAALASDTRPFRTGASRAGPRFP